MHKLDVILRTCNNSIFDKTRSNATRICGDNKEEMILKCLTSIIKSINNSSFNIVLTVLDDNSSCNFVTNLKSVLDYCNKQSKFISLTERGPNHSAYQQFYIASQCEDLIYTVEDDYLHETSAIDSMLTAFQYLSTRFHKENIMLFPFDCPLRYKENEEEPTILLHDGTRYWRQVSKTSNTFFTTASILKKHFEVYKILALQYPMENEGTTINNLYKSYARSGGDITVFNPIPSLAYHLSFSEPASMGLDIHSWQELWNKF
jgi:hypothetical protein